MIEIEVEQGVYKRAADLPGQLSIKTVNNTNYTITDEDGYDLILVSTGDTGDKTILLPTAADNQGRKISIMKVNDGAGKVIIDGEGTEKIIIGGEEFTTIDLNNKSDKITIICDGTQWWKITFSNLDEISDGTTYQKVHGDYIDANGKIEKIKSDCTFENAVTRYYSVPLTGWSMNSDCCIGRLFGLLWSCGTSVSLPISLPHGAIITNLYSYAYKITDNNIRVELFRVPVTSDAETSMVFHYHSSVGEQNSNSINYPIVDNVNYKYYVKCLRNAHISVAGLSGIVITYTITEPKP